jgi:hypothetical protein
MATRTSTIRTGYGSGIHRRRGPAQRGGIANAWTPDLGLAVSDEIAGVGSSRINFQHGTVTWSAFGGAQVTHVENPNPTSVVSH